MPVDGPDDARAGMAENRNGPAIRKPQLHYVCWFQRVWQLSCTRRESPRVFVRASIVPTKINLTIFSAIAINMIEFL